jgi:phosphoribosyl 1,2-cyclic phosphate phosphodiesterase
VRLNILGAGTSSGVPRIGPDWGACDPAEPRNERSRASILIRSETTTILVDTSPDLRRQLLAAGVSAVDAVLWTHDHADHCHGIDDLRQLYHARGAPVEGYARAATLELLRSRFAYAFEGHLLYPPVVTGQLLTDRLTIGDIDVRVVDQPHGTITSAGFRFDYRGASIAYSTDFHAMTEAMAATFAGVDIWVVDALRRKPHPTHMHLDATLAAIDAVKPGRAILTHMDQTMDYATLCAELPEGVVPGHDGLEVTL